MLNKRIKAYILGAAIIFTFVLFNYYYQPMFKQIDEFYLKADTQRIKSKNLDKEKVKLAKTKNEYDEVVKRYNTLKNKTFNVATVEDASLALQKEILKIFEEQGLVADSYNNFRPKDRKDYYVVTTRINFKGNIGQILKLIDAINKSDKIINIDYLYINENRRDYNTLRVELSVFTIYFKGAV